MVCSICNSADAIDRDCPCGTSMCRACSRRCVLEFTHACVCIGCQRPWSMEETVSRLGKTFWNTTYRRMRRRELGRIDETLIAETSDEAAHVREERRLSATMEEVARQIRSGRIDMVPEFRRLRYALLHVRAPDPSTRTLMRRCTEVDCPGALMVHPENPNHLLCQRCNTRTCEMCGECVGDGTLHECDESLVASRQAILRECKPCVRCQAPSMRTEGCPTMWCPHCHTFWNWDTERIIESRGTNPHNPDHRAFLNTRRCMRREIDDVPCGGLPDGIAVHNSFIRDAHAINNLSVFAPIVIDALECIHLSQRMRHRYPLTWNAPEHFRTVRVSYILGDITRESYEGALERMERTFQFRREVGIALELLVLGAADLFQRFCAGADDIFAVCFALSALRQIVDDRMICIGTAFQRKSPHLDNEWKWSGLRQ